MTLATKRRVIAAKIETTAGIAEALTSTNAAFYAMDATLVTNRTFTKRKAQGSLSNTVASPGTTPGTCTFSVDLMTLAPWADILLPACGWVKSTGEVWKPSSLPTYYKTVTIGVNTAGKLKRLAGAMGKFDIELTAGQIGKVTFEFQGRYLAESDATQFTPQYTVGTESSGPQFAGATVTLATVATGLRQLTINSGNAVSLIEDVTAAGGIARAWLDDRDIGGTMDPYEQLVATRDDYDKMDSLAEQALAVAYGSMSISIPKLQILTLAAGERNGLSARAVGFQANQDTIAGDDEIAIDLDTA